MMCTWATELGGEIREATSWNSTCNTHKAATDTAEEMARVPIARQKRILATVHEWLVKG
jgi:hypothetical protein